MRASGTRVGPPALLDAPASKTTPSTRRESSIVPPTFVRTRTSRRSTAAGRAGSRTRSTASTAMGASRDE